MMRCLETQPPGMERGREEHPYSLQPVEMAAKARTDHLPLCLAGPEAADQKT